MTGVILVRIAVGVVTDALGAASEQPERPRRRFILENTGFDEVPPRYRELYRRRDGPGDALRPNEVLCPGCKVVIRSSRDCVPTASTACRACRGS